jgi:hypothetical protein
MDDQTVGRMDGWTGKINNKCFKAFPRAEVLSGSNILTSTWARKKKANRTF